MAEQMKAQGFYDTEKMQFEQLTVPQLAGIEIQVKSLAALATAPKLTTSPVSSGLWKQREGDPVKVQVTP